MVDSRVATHQCLKNFKPHPGMEHKGDIQWIPNSEILSIDGRDVLLGGVVEYWPTRGHLWSFPSADIRKEDWVPIVRYLKKRIAQRNYLRLEASVALGFQEGYRLLWALGFNHEYVMHHYYPDGTDAILFVRYGNG